MCGKKKKHTKFFYNFFWGLRHDEQKKSHHMILHKITQGIKKRHKKTSPKMWQRERERESSFQG
jgi:hypothetical protein